MRILPLLLLPLAWAPAALAKGDAPEPPVEQEPPPLLADPQLLDFVQAPYPPQAREQGIEAGFVIEPQRADDPQSRNRCASCHGMSSRRSPERPALRSIRR